MLTASQREVPRQSLRHLALAGALGNPYAAYLRGLNGRSRVSNT